MQVTCTFPVSTEAHLPSRKLVGEISKELMNKCDLNYTDQNIKKNPIIYTRLI